MQVSEPGICPNCGSEDVDYHPSHPIDTDAGVAYRGKCNVCGARFLEQYELVWLDTQLVSVPKRRKRNGNKIPATNDAESSE